MTLDDMVAEWLEYAQRDLDVARMLSDRADANFNAIICYHAQQSAEKALKAILVKNDIDPPKVHDLVQLCKMCGEFDSECNALEKYCEVINQYGNATRYPQKNKPGIEDTEAAIQNAEKILKWVSQKLRREL